VWAARALDGYIEHQPMKQELKRIGKDLAITPVLYPDMPDIGHFPI
jgi:hypothetical protein